MAYLFYLRKKVAGASSSTVPSGTSTRSATGTSPSTQPALPGRPYKGPRRSECSRLLRRHQRQPRRYHSGWPDSCHLHSPKDACQGAGKTLRVPEGCRRGQSCRGPARGTINPRLGLQDSGSQGSSEIIDAVYEP